MDEANKKFTLAGKEFHEGDCISLDGSTGAIYDGIIPTVDATIAGEFGRIMGWADKYRTMKVRTNADTPADAKKARELGAEGIGCLLYTSGTDKSDIGNCRNAGRSNRETKYMRCTAPRPRYFFR